MPHRASAGSPSRGASTEGWHSRVHGAAWGTWLAAQCKGLTRAPGTEHKRRAVGLGKPAREHRVLVSSEDKVYNCIWPLREQPGRRAMKNKGRAGGCGQEAAAAPRCSLGRVPCTGIPVMPLTDAQVPANVSGKSSTWPTRAGHLRGSARRARQTGQGWGKAPCRAGGSLHWSHGSLWGHGCSSPMCPGLHGRAGTAQRHGHRPALPACWSSLRLSARFRLDMPFSVEKITVVNGKPGRDRAAAHPTALLVLTKSIYI